MKAGRAKVNEICFAAEGLSGPAEAASPQKLGRLTEMAPSGRLFGAITTLSDSSAKSSLDVPAMQQQELAGTNRTASHRPKRPKAG
jgi:hypothetical protein